MRVQSFIVDNRRGLRAHCRAESIRTNDNLIDWQGSPLTDCYEWWLCSLSLVIGCMLMIFQVRPLLGQGKWNFNTEVCEALDLLQTLTSGFIQKTI